MVTIMAKKTIDSGIAHNADELTDLLLNMSVQAIRSGHVRDASEILLESSVVVYLIEETLTDGSKVYNVEVK